MKNIINKIISQRKITIFIFALLGLYGLYSYYLIPKQESPDVKAPDAVITTIFAGASADDVETQVTKVIEDAVSEIKGFKKVQSWSSNSFSLVWVTIDHDSDPDKSWEELRRNINDIIHKLPKQCERPFIDTKVVETAGIILSLSGKNYGYEQLSNFADEFKDVLMPVNGISRTELFGKISNTINIEIDNTKLNKFDLTIAEIAQILKSTNVTLPGGLVEEDDANIPIELAPGYGSISDIENTILITNYNDGVVRLKDVATINVGTLKNYREKYKQDGENAVLLAVYFKEDFNIVNIGQDVRKIIEDVKHTFPSDLKINEVIFAPEEIEKANNDFITNLLQGIVLVIIVVFLGMGFRSAVVVSTSIPLSILLTYLVMGFTGIKIHNISTAALIIALGLLVDNAIVVVEAIQFRINDGMDKFKAALEGTLESAGPIFSSTLTTVAAFLPLLFIPGATGQFIRSIPVLVMISLSASYIVAILFIPAFSAFLLIPEIKKNKNKKYRIRNWFHNSLIKSLNNRFKTVVISVIVLLVFIVLSDELKKQFFPYADKNIIYIDVQGNSSNVKNTEKIVENIENLISKEKEITSYTAGIGNGIPRFYLTGSSPLPSPNFGQFVLRINIEDSKYETYFQYREYLQRLLETEIFGAKISVNLLESTDPKEGRVLVRVSGKNLERIKTVAGKIKENVAKIPGTIKLQDDIYYPIKQFKVEVNNEKAGLFGLSNMEIQSNIFLAMQGEKVSSYRKGGKKLDIRLRSNIETIDNLQNLNVRSQGSDKLLNIRNLCETKLVSSTPLITRFNKQKCVKVFCDVEEDYSAVEAEDIIEYKILPRLNTAGTSITFAGEREEINRDFGTMGIAILFAILLVYTILLVQFKNFVQPFVIILSVPLAFVGGILGLLLFELPLSFTALLGVASLVGIAVNDAIILIAFINNKREEGFDIRSSCIDAAKKRFTPIMMTTVTTVMGLLPLAFSGSEMFGPMSAVIIVGLVAATVLTLIIVPTIYSIMVKE